MNMLIGKVAGLVLLAGLAGCRGTGAMGSGPMAMLEDRGVPNVSMDSVAVLESLRGRDVKVFGGAIATKWSNTCVQTDNGRVWEVQIRTLDAWPADILGRRVHVKGVLRVYRQTLDAAGNPVNERGEIVPGFGGVRDVFYLADCIYERG